MAKDPGVVKITKEVGQLGVYDFDDGPLDEFLESFARKVTKMISPPWGDPVVKGDHDYESHWFRIYAFRDETEKEKAARELREEKAKAREKKQKADEAEALKQRELKLLAQLQKKYKA